MLLTALSLNVALEIPINKIKQNKDFSEKPKSKMIVCRYLYGKLEII